MELSKLLGLRPKQQTAEAISTAIGKAEQEQARAQGRIEALQAGRGALLLTGDAKAVEAGERDLADARAEVERLGVMIEALKPQLSAATLQEKGAAFKAKLALAEKHAAQFVEWWTSRYPALAQEIREGLLMEEQAEKELTELHMQLAQDAELARFLEGPLPTRPFNRVNADPQGLHAMKTMGSQTRLPPVTGDHGTPFWGLGLR